MSAAPRQGSGPQDPTGEAERWIDDCLGAHGHRRVGTLATHSVRPWATVYAVPTDSGTFWFKACSQMTRHEVEVYSLLGRLDIAEHVVAAIGVDAGRGWLLLADAGAPIGDDHNNLAAAMADGLCDYGHLQRVAAPHADDLVRAGVPDMRPHQMPARFDQALRTSALDADLAERLDAIRPIYAQWCEHLARSAVPASIDHNDLHPWNMIRNGRRTRFYDWGDSVIAHPFAALLVPLGFIQRTLQCAPEAPPMLAVIDAYTEAVTGHPDPYLRTDAMLACRVAKVARALTWQRGLAGDDGNDDGGGDDEEGSTAEFGRAVTDTLASLLDDSYLGGA